MPTLTRPRVMATVMFLLVLSVWNRAVAQGESSGGEVFNALRLKEAGYPVESPDALIKALGDPDFYIAATAARFLGQRPSTPEAVNALKRLLERAEHPSVAMTAAGSLVKLGASGWQDEAARRLREIPLGNTAVLLAGFLAQSKRSDGWPVIQEALRENGELNAMAVVAARTAHDFRGLKNLDGSGPIDVSTELKRALAFHANDARVEGEIAKELAKSAREGSAGGRRP